jgi:putative FmdB family regulatory protein
MPFYEYECPHCGYHDEVLQKISDKPLSQCPSCGKKGLRKLMSAPVFRLKGSGWYETDFKSDKEQKRNLAGDAEPKADAAKSEPAKPETKSEAKTESKAESKTETRPADKPAARPDKPAARPVKRAPSRASAKSKGARKSRR